jgi:broad specificity phosphatase PhoE
MLDLNNLKHKYFAVRHGHSVPNEQGLVVGKIENGIKLEYGLTDKGRKQAKLSAQLYKLQSKTPVKDIVIIHSPFSRTTETAQIVAQEFEGKIFGENQDLCERNFGDFELGDEKNYQQIWEQDKINPDSTLNNSESVNQVLTRMLKVIEKYEKLDEEYGQNIFLITHADSTHILDTAFRNLPVSNHRDVPFIRNAEIRALN